MKHYLLLISILPVLIITSCGEAEEPIAEERNDGGITLNIPLSGSLQNPAFSPDDEFIIFTRFINGYNVEPAEVYKFNFATEELTLLISDGSGNINLPGSSWNNGKIVFASTRDPHDEIYVILEDGIPGDEIKITSRPNKVAYEPSLSPDGEWIVFESHILDVEGDGIITKYKMDGSSSYIELSPQGDDCRQPNWSPAGNKILYQKLENEEWNIWIMNADGTENVQVTSNLGNCTDASFTADGQFIIYSSDLNVNIANIYKVSIDGSNAVRLTDFEGYDGATSISYDGVKLVFESINADPDQSSGTKIVLLNL